MGNKASRRERHSGSYYPSTNNVKIKIPKSSLSGKTDRRSYDPDSLEVVTGSFGATKQAFYKIPINPKLSKEALSSRSINTKKTLETKTNLNIDFHEIADLVLDSSSKKYKESTNIFGIDSNIDGLMNLFYQAYANHGSVFLRPDDIWFHFLQQVGCIIDKDPKKHRRYFVSHKGEKLLQVNVNSYSKDDVETFIKGICKQMEQHVKNNVSNLMTSEYSTSCDVDTISTKIALMTNMKHYFEYRMAVLCGIREIYLGGTVEDWAQLRENIGGFDKFGPSIAEYSASVAKVIDEFVLARQGKPDVGFFNRIFRQDAKVIGEFELGYGSGTRYMYITGWILNLYHNGREMHNKALPERFTSNISTCPFVLCMGDGTEYNKVLCTTTPCVKYHSDYEAFSLVKGWCSGSENPKKDNIFDFDGTE